MEKTEIHMWQIAWQLARMRELLDSMEFIIRSSPRDHISWPIVSDGDTLVDLTPESYLNFKRSGFEGKMELGRYDRFLPFFQFASADLSSSVSINSFELSSLHKIGSDTQFGLRVEPIQAGSQNWFTYEFILPTLDLGDLAWVDVILKLSLDERADFSCQFIVEGDGFQQKIESSRGELSEFSSFYANRLNASQLAHLTASQKITGLRLVLSIGKVPLPLSMYSYLVLGKKR